YALSRLRRTHRLVIVGDGEERGRLTRLAHDMGLERSIHFTGTVKNPYPLVARSNLFVLSSRWKGYPNAILEALALRIPVVSTDCPHGPREVLQNETLGR